EPSERLVEDGNDNGTTADAEQAGEKTDNRSGDEECGGKNEQLRGRYQGNSLIEIVDQHMVGAHIRAFPVTVAARKSSAARRRADLTGSSRSNWGRSGAT